jgi:UDP-N-acetylglucosamine 2-epimerase (non-hydrolysing)
MERLIQPPLWEENNLEKKEYLVMTLHRPSNVDGYENLRTLLSLINDNVGDKKVVFPMHPRTKKMFDQLGISFDKLIITGPMSYLEFIYMIKYSAGVVTDSGGITEETTVLDVPCMTLRNSTERPETVTMGTNEIVGTDPNNIVPYLQKLIAGDWKSGAIPDLWDGKTADRIVKIVAGL